MLSQHRADKGAVATESAENGYVPESHLIRLLEDIGFELVAKSEINANPKDIKDYPEGVWTLPPSLRLKEKRQGKVSGDWGKRSYDIEVCQTYHRPSPPEHIMLHAFFLRCYCCAEECALPYLSNQLPSSSDYILHIHITQNDRNN